MTEFVFPAPSPAAIEIAGSQARFPVRRVLCVGRNYAAHRREMGGDERDPPFFFAKPPDALAPGGGSVPFPPATAELHHEVELVVGLSAGGSDVAPEKALGLVFGYAVGVDLTRRDLQNQARAKGQPWEAGKAFDYSAPISALQPWREGPPPDGRIHLSVNGVVRQDARLNDMIWKVPEIIAEASRLWALAPGDLIFTGTPEGVGPLRRGDLVACAVDAVGALSFTIG